MAQQLPKFLVFRFPPGGGANFLTSILQCSPEVGHWVPLLEEDKANADWLSYFKKSFQPDLTTWLDHEPINNQQFGTREIFSAWYPRGNDLTISEFLEQEQKQCSDFYFKLKENNVFIPVYWHKELVPSYFQNATFINIMLDQPSLDWFDESLQRKHYQVVAKHSDNSVTVRNHRHRPNFIPTSFNGENEFEKTYNTFDTFINLEIKKNKWREHYQNPNYVTTGYTLHLGDLLDYQLFKGQYTKLCAYLSLTPIIDSLLEQLHAHWRGCHDY